MNQPRIVLTAALIALAAVGSGCPKRPPAAVPAAAVVRPPALVCHVGGTMLPILERLAAQYCEATGEAVELNTGDSGSLLALIETQKQGDLYVCHDPFLDMLMTRRLGVEAWTVAELTPVIAVPKGNPKAIHSLQDLVRPEIELFLTDYEYSTLGRLLPALFGKAGIDFAELNRRKAISTHRSGSQAANVVKMGNADAAIVWDAVVALRSDALEAVAITACLPQPYVDTVTSATGKAYPLMPVRVTVATLACSSQPDRAAAFARFVAAAERQDAFRRLGYTITAAHLRQEYTAGQAIPRP
jgi:molybdate transport system substrate-binding protein